MFMLKNGKTISIRLTVLTVFLIVATLTAGLALGLQYYFNRNLAKAAAKSSFRSVSEIVGQRILSLDRQSVNLVNIVTHFKDIESYPDPEQERRYLPLLGGAMEQNPSIYAIYVGYENGEFFELINLESSASIRAQMGAAPYDRWVVVRIEGKGEARKKTLVFYNQDFEIRAYRDEQSDYDPRSRPWYQMALGSRKVVKTSPYMFFHLGLPGVTFAKAANRGQRVVAVDISLGGMKSFLGEQRLPDHSDAFLFTADGSLTAQATSELETKEEDKGGSIDLTPEEQTFVNNHPSIKASNELDWPPFDFAISGKPRGYSVDLLNMLAQKTGLRIEYVNGYSWVELVELFKKGELDLLHSLQRTPEREKIGRYSQPYLPMPRAFVYRAGMQPVSGFHDLKDKILAIPRGWSTNSYITANYPHIERLYVSNTLEAMRAVSEGRAHATLDSRPVLEYLVGSHYLRELVIGEDVKELAEEKHGLHFIVQPDKEVLASLLNKAMASLTPEELAGLKNKWLEPQIETKPVAKTAVEAKTLPHPELLELAKRAGKGGELRSMKIEGREYFGYVSRLLSDYGTDEFLGFLVPVGIVIKPYMEKVRFSILITFCLLFCLGPVVGYCTSLIVQPINALDLESQKVIERRYDEVERVESNIKEIVDLSRSMVEMASSIKAYEKSQRDLMDSFIKLIATAIDHKSPYTLGHCERVPEIAIMLAREASNSTHDRFGSFKLATDDEWHEFRTAAWLHDCGKVTTPEYIVDKGTKLEAIYNRIHEVRMRFEVLMRDAEIDYWRKKADGAIDDETLEKELLERQTQIKDDFEFVAECNVGGEFMAPEKVEQLNAIAKKTWVRYLDDRLGLSHVELMRYPKEVSDLPCEEPLLSNRSEHIIHRPASKLLGDDDLKFSMEAPEHLYNMGEVYNLGISRGTLTDEDRYKINEHIVSTIRMLETLPFPEHMARIPEYAGAHHETLIGTGYPNKLVETEIGTSARIIALADVFEALTASDRPYKKAKTLSEAIKILSFMVKDQHIDKDLFKLFLESGIYMDYAQKHLKPEQLDDVDVAGYVSSIS